ncbi:MAG: KpsF/GutQ family sugar-phosphate isomerase [Desulfobacteraceae bacterium]|jgi:arabinose-5-phosphate isomerase
MNLSSAISEVTESTIQLGADTIREQARTLFFLADSLDNSFDNAARAILETSGHLIICGIGKSGLIGRKLAVTFSSTGTPSFFFHPKEAVYGELSGMSSDSIVLLISESGERREILQLIPFFRRRGIRTIGLVGNRNSSLAQQTDMILAVSDVYREAEKNDFFQSQTLAIMSLGDALAATLMRLRHFQTDKFPSFDTGDSLKQRLVTRVRDMMHKRDEKDFPIVQSKTSIKKTIWKMTKGRMGLALVIERDHLMGIITDRDLRQAMINSNVSFFNVRAVNVMNCNPITIFEDAPLHEAERLMNRHKLYALIVVDGNARVTGVVEIF